jgi:hypothetical protein
MHGTLVEAIHVLSDDGDAGTVDALLKPGKRNVRWFGWASLGSPAERAEEAPGGCHLYG